jgi:hypothetical protein
MLADRATKDEEIMRAVFTEAIFPHISAVWGQAMLDEERKAQLLAEQKALQDMEAQEAEAASSASEAVASGDARSTASPSGSSASEGSVTSGATLAVCLLRTMLSFDGEVPALACLQRLVEQHDKKLDPDADVDVELLKFTAGCSSTQQSADRAPTFRSMHGFTNNEQFCLTERDVTALLENGHETLAETARTVRALLARHAEMDADLFNQSVSFFFYARDFLEGAVHGTNAREGWRLSGVYPFKPEVVMANWTGWLYQTDERKAELLASLPALAEKILTNGKLTGADMDHVCGEEGRREGLDDKPLHWQNALWLNNAKLLQVARVQKARIAAVEEKKAQLQQAVEAKGQPYKAPRGGNVCRFCPLRVDGMAVPPNSYVKASAEQKGKWIGCDMCEWWTCHVCTAVVGDDAVRLHQNCHRLSDAAHALPDPAANAPQAPAAARPGKKRKAK